MTWKNDGHGLVFGSSEIKLYGGGGHTWAMKLSRLACQKGTVRIITYSLPRIDYVIKQLSRRPRNIFLICHSKFVEQALEIKQHLPDVRVAVGDDIHAKVCLIEPKTVYVGSANFGVSKWHETVVGIRSKKAHDWYVENSFSRAWGRCIELKKEENTK